MHKPAQNPHQLIIDMKDVGINVLVCEQLWLRGAAKLPYLRWRVWLYLLGRRFPKLVRLIVMSELAYCTNVCTDESRVAVLIQWFNLELLIK